MQQGGCEVDEQQSMTCCVVSFFWHSFHLLFTSISGILDQLQQQGYDPRILRQEATHFLNCMREEYGAEGCGFAAAGS